MLVYSFFIHSFKSLAFIQISFIQKNIRYENSWDNFGRPTLADFQTCTIRFFIAKDGRFEICGFGFRISKNLWFGLISWVYHKIQIQETLSWIQIWTIRMHTQKIFSYAPRSCRQRIALFQADMSMHAYNIVKFSLILESVLMLHDASCIPQSDSDSCCFRIVNLHSFINL